MTTTRSMVSNILRLTAVAAIGWSISTLAAAGGYVATVLPTLGGANTLPNGIDNSGAVTGESNTGQARHAFLWKNGVMTDLGVIGTGGSTNSWGTKSNPAGQVVGTLFGGGTPYGFVHSGGVMTALASGYGYGINAAGDVVGGGDTRAFLYSDGVLTDLGTFGRGSATARAINNVGLVVGYASNTDGSGLRGFVWDGASASFIAPMAGDSTIALDINDAGEVVGMTSIAADPNAWHVFVWKNGVMTDTGISASKYTLPASGYAINNAGNVLTPSGVLVNGVFTPIAQMLPPELAPGMRDGAYWMFPRLTGMNDAGQVTGSINRLDMSTYATKVVGFVLTPASICGD